MRTKHGHRNMLRGVPFPLNDSLLNDMPIFNSTSIEFSLTCFSNDGGGGQSKRILLWGAGKVLCDSQEHIRKATRYAFITCTVQTDHTFRSKMPAILYMSGLASEQIEKSLQIYFVLHQQRKTKNVHLMKVMISFPFWSCRFFSFLR